MATAAETCECGRIFPKAPNDMECHRTTCMYARLHDLEQEKQRLLLQVDAARKMLQLHRCTTLGGNERTGRCSICEWLSQFTEKTVGEPQKDRETILKGLWQLLRAYAGGGMPPLITKGIRLACQNVGMSKDHIASAELGGDTPDYIREQNVCRVGMPFGQSGVPDFCGEQLPCKVHTTEKPKCAECSGPQGTMKCAGVHGCYCGCHAEGKADLKRKEGS